MRHHALTGLACVVVGGLIGLRVPSSMAAQDTHHGQIDARSTTAAPKPHPQAVLPPLALPSYQLFRPAEVVRATYKFAAEHPEVLTYIPCFCGCDQEGHRGSEDCFVKARAKNGDVTSWNDHGMVCPMCLAVAEEAMHLHEAGASIRAIRADVERKYGHTTENRTPTPPPPAH